MPDLQNKLSSFSSPENFTAFFDVARFSTTSHGGSVSKAIGYGLDDRRLIPGRGTDFSFHHNVKKRLFGALSPP
jgi:hypothetical protein